VFSSAFDVDLECRAHASRSAAASDYISEVSSVIKWHCGQRTRCERHKDSSGRSTFLYQVGIEEDLEVLDANDSWICASPIAGTFVVNFGMHSRLLRKELTRRRFIAS
jgi:isopenicillin N synthase-like dioxygenase